MYMSAYVEEAGRTFLCKASDGAGCSDKELKFIAEWQGKSVDDIDAQLHRLNGMAASGMRAECAACPAAPSCCSSSSKALASPAPPGARAATAHHVV